MKFNYQGMHFGAFRCIANKISKISNIDKFRCYKGCRRDSLFTVFYPLKAEKFRLMPE